MVQKRGSLLGGINYHLPSRVARFCDTTKLLLCVGCRAGEVHRLGVTGTLHAPVCRKEQVGTWKVFFEMQKGLSNVKGSIYQEGTVSRACGKARSYRMPLAGLCPPFNCCGHEATGERRGQLGTAFHCPLLGTQEVSTGFQLGQLPLSPRPPHMPAS